MTIRDAIVLGAGPAGCAAAAALARAGRDVLLLDREPKPFFKIGESLLPWNVPVFERLGLSQKIAAAGFQPKFGALFTNEATGGVRQVVFREAWNGEHPSAWQVQREVFDGLLADHARSCGVEVRRGVNTDEVLFESGRATGVRVSEAGTSEAIPARVVVDATGQAALLASRLKMRRGDPKLKKMALFAHYTGAWRAEGERGGDILLPFLPEVWYWVIPFADGSASVGAVFSPALLAGETGSREEIFDRLLGRSAKMREYLAGSKRKTPVRTVSDYSVTAERFAGDGWVLVGDAAAFLDPVFSTGVFLGMSAGVRAAAVIHRALGEKGRVDGPDFAAYEKTTRRMLARFRPFVYGYYDPVFARMFCEEAPLDVLRAAVTSILAGDVEKPAFGVRFWNRMTLTIFRLVSLFERAPSAPAPSASSPAAA